MKIAFVYPPYTQKGKYPNLPQNRQFIYTASNEVRIYPVVMATAATWMKDLGHEVLWLDAITRRMSRNEYEQEFSSFGADIIVLESKTPIMKKLWKEVDGLKKHKKFRGSKVVLVGDHTSQNPQESLENSDADFVLCGGDYDFLLVNLLAHLTKRKKLEPGIWQREKHKNGKTKIIDSGKFTLSHDLSLAPMIDRKLTRFADYGEAYLYRPCAYVMFGRGCGIDTKRSGSCTFCVWQHALWKCGARIISPQKAAEEVSNLYKLGVREIFDDAGSGVCWNYEWMAEFGKILKKKKLFGKVVFSANARGDQLDKRMCTLLKDLNFRLLKVGLESGSNETLRKIGKKETIEQIIGGVKNAKDAGLRVMLTVMTGYPWETRADVQKTYEVTKELTLYKTKAGDCLQASVLTPYPGTPLWAQAKREKWFTIDPDNYEKYDMSKPVLKSKINPTMWCNKIWAIQKSPEFIIKSGLSVRSVDDLKLLARGARSLLGHLTDF